MRSFSGPRVTSEYLKSFRGQLNRYMWRMTHGRMCCAFRMEPKSKNAMTTEEKVEFQRALLDQMRAGGKRSFRSRIAADLTITPARRNPPYIHTATKNILDLCRQPLACSGIRRKALAYEDDKQIAYLSVKYNLGDSEPGIAASFYPLRHLLADIALAGAILDGDFDCDEGFDRDLISGIVDDLGEHCEDEDSRERANEWADEYVDLLRSRDTSVSRLGEEAYRAAVALSHAIAQEAVLNSFRMSIRDLYYLLGQRSSTMRSGAGCWPEMEAALGAQGDQSSDLLTRPPLRIRLSGVPIREGGTAGLREEIRSALMEYRSRHSLLNPLRIPVAVELLYEPPSRPGFYKDLDNIMCLVLAIFHELFQPPVTFSPGDPGSVASAGGLSRKSAAGPWCVTRCEIIEMPRHGSEPTDGFLALGITSDSPGSDSVWTRVTALLNVLWRHAQL